MNEAKTCNSITSKRAVGPSVLGYQILINLQCVVKPVRKRRYFKCKFAHALQVVGMPQAGVPTMMAAYPVPMVIFDNL